MRQRELKQYGWMDGPVECRCTGCDWSESFTATDSSVPADILSAFTQHSCIDYGSLYQGKGEPVRVIFDDDDRKQ